MTECRRQFCKHADPFIADEGYSQVAYEKGSNLLLHIERMVGGLDVFIPYMKDYDRTFTGTSITTDQWRNHMFHYFGSLPEGDELVKQLSKLDWDEVSLFKDAVNKALLQRERVIES